MSRRPRYPADGLQLRLLPAAAIDAEASRWASEQQLRSEMELFARRLVEIQSYQPSSAGTHRRVIEAMARKSAGGTMRKLCKDPAVLAAAIADAEHRGTRGHRHLAAQDFLSLLESELTPAVVEDCREAIEEAFGGRTVPSQHLVDRELGGSVKEVRLRPPLDWVDGDRMIDASTGGSSATGVRDRAILAMLLRSGLTPGQVGSMDWERVVPSFESDAEVGRLRIETRTGEKRLAIHETARTALRELWRADGEPATGPVFTSRRQPRSMLSANHVADIVRKALARAGYPPVDRRHLRVPFARWLIDVRGWGELATSEALGFYRVRALRQFLRRAAESAAQIRSTEAVTLGGSAAREPLSVQPTPSAVQGLSGIRAG